MLLVGSGRVGSGGFSKGHGEIVGTEGREGRDGCSIRDWRKESNI